MNPRNERVGSSAIRNELSLNFKTSASAHWGVDLRAMRATAAARPHSVAPSMKFGDA